MQQIQTRFDNKDLQQIQLLYCNIDIDGETYDHVHFKTMIIITSIQYWLNSDTSIG